MKLISSYDVYNNSDRDTKKRYLPTDAICIRCGVIFNGRYEDDCVICYEDNEHDNLCNHKEFITGKPCVDIRNLLDMQIEELSYVNMRQGHSNGSRNIMIINLMREKYTIKNRCTLDNRINESLIKKITHRSRRRAWYIKDIRIDIKKYTTNLTIIKESDCINNEII